MAVTGGSIKWRLIMSCMSLASLLCKDAQLPVDPLDKRKDIEMSEEKKQREILKTIRVFVNIIGALIVILEGINYLRKRDD